MPRALRDFRTQSGTVRLGSGGLLHGLAFAAIVYRTNFCTMGSISDFMTFEDYRRFRSWVLASAVALVGAQVLAAAGVVQLEQSMYLASSFNWLGHVAGGLLFGFGMVLAGGCASKNLARAGGGDLRALLTLIVIGLVAYMAIGGLFGPIRSALEQWTAIDLKRIGLSTQGLGAFLGKATGMPGVRGDMIATTVIALAALVYCFKDAAFRTSQVHILAGVGVGLCVVAGWALTGLAFDEMATKPTQPISLTYVRPTGDAIEWLQRYTAGPVPAFGVATVFGALWGARSE